MPVPLEVVKCYKYIDTQRKNYVEELKEIVAIGGVSADPKSRKTKLLLMIEWMQQRLEGLGFEVEMREMGTYTPEGSDSSTDIPLLILGTLGKSPAKKTLLYYCHLDVAAAADVDRGSQAAAAAAKLGFEMLERNGKLYGRGTARMKGPLLCFIHAIECYKALRLPLPVNVKIFCESMYEVGSVGVESNLDALKSGFLVGIDCVLINESRWIGKKYPCVIHGFRGVCYLDVCVVGPKSDLHSGEYGGILYEPMQDILFLANTLVDAATGRIKIPGFYDDVAQITPDEEDIYRSLKVDMEDYRDKAGLMKLAQHGKVVKQTLMHVWRDPSFYLHFIDNHSECDCSVRLTIPKKVTARFSLRLVPRQSHERVCRLLYRYVEKQLRDRCTPNNVTINATEKCNPWLENHLHWNYEAAKIATKQVYKAEANLIREGNEFPTLLEIQKALPGKNILMLPLVDNQSNTDAEDVEAPPPMSLRISIVPRGETVLLFSLIVVGDSL